MIERISQRSMWDRFFAEGIAWSVSDSDSEPRRCWICAHSHSSGRILVVDDYGPTESSSEFICDPCWHLIYVRLSRLPDPGPSVSIDMIMQAEFNRWEQTMMERLDAES